MDTLPMAELINRFAQGLEPNIRRAVEFEILPTSMKQLAWLSALIQLISQIVAAMIHPIPSSTQQFLQC
jgi:hypothetical protein